MNLKKIKKKYPLAFNKLMEWLVKENPYLESLWNIENYILNTPEGYLGKHYRDLYDFFDENKLYIKVNMSVYEDFYIYITIYEKNEMTTCGETDYFKSRSKCEKNGFKLAFKLLNKKLEDEKI